MPLLAPSKPLLAPSTPLLAPSTPLLAYAPSTPLLVGLQGQIQSRQINSASCSAARFGTPRWVHEDGPWGRVDE